MAQPEVRPHAGGNPDNYYQGKCPINTDRGSGGGGKGSEDITQQMNIKSQKGISFADIQSLERVKNSQKQSESIDRKTKDKYENHVAVNNCVEGLLSFNVLSADKLQ